MVIGARSGLAPMTDILIQRNLRWTGHVYRMDAERLPKQLLYSQVSSGAKNQAVYASDLNMLLRETWSGGILVLILSRLELENGQSGKPWFEDQSIEQSSSARRTANDDDDLIIFANAKGNIRSQLGLFLCHPLDVHLRFAVTLLLGLPSNLYPNVHSYRALSLIYNKFCAFNFTIMY